MATSMLSRFRGKAKEVNARNGNISSDDEGDEQTSNNSKNNNKISGQADDDNSDSDVEDAEGKTNKVPKSPVRRRMFDRFTRGRGRGGTGTINDANNSKDIVRESSDEDLDVPSGDDVDMQADLDPDASDSSVDENEENSNGKRKKKNRKKRGGVSNDDDNSLLFQTGVLQVIKRPEPVLRPISKYETSHKVLDVLLTLSAFSLVISMEVVCFWMSGCYVEWWRPAFAHDRAVPIFESRAFFPSTILQLLLLLPCGYWVSRTERTAPIGAWVCVGACYCAFVVVLCVKNAAAWADAGTQAKTIWNTVPAVSVSSNTTSPSGLRTAVTEAFLDRRFYGTEEAFQASFVEYHLAFTIAFLFNAATLGVSLLCAINLLYAVRRDSNRNNGGGGFVNEEEALLGRGNDVHGGSKRRNKPHKRDVVIDANHMRDTGNSSESGGGGGEMGSRRKGKSSRKDRRNKRNSSSPVKQWGGRRRKSANEINETNRSRSNKRRNSNMDKRSIGGKSPHSKNKTISWGRRKRQTDEEDDDDEDL